MRAGHTAAERLSGGADHVEEPGVAWNNRNAEDAMRAFARLCRAIEGLSTPKGMEQYLILLSVCQTCRYSGLDFLAWISWGFSDQAKRPSTPSLASPRIRKRATVKNELNVNGP
jgi:hypothetical protein